MSKKSKCNSVWDEFRELLINLFTRKAVDRKVEEAKDAYNLAFEAGREKGYYQGYDDALNKHPHKYEPDKTLFRPDILVLFVKADRTITSIDIIRKHHSLVGVNNNQLTSNVIRVWVGTEKEYQYSGLQELFNYNETQSDIGQEYDVVAIKIPYPTDIEHIDAKSDEFAIRQVVRKACEQGLSCTDISNRIPLLSIEKFSLIRL